MTWRVAALYKFAPIADPAAEKEKFRTFCRANGILGTLIFADEGVNGTVASEDPSAIDQLLEMLYEIPGVKPLELKFSEWDNPPFSRIKVKHKAEIVTMRAGKINPRETVGTYVAPEEWNDLINDPDVTIVDARNSYEYDLGTFKGAIDCKTEGFSEFPDFVQKHLNPGIHKKVAMFCTGGIRCEKASSYMLQNGFEEVYHLKGGILKYIEDTPKEESLWDGQCYVFDDRGALKHGLEVGWRILKK